MGMHERPTVGLPPYTGFEVGYHLAQAYLRNAGRSTVEAAVIPAADIIAGASFFQTRHRRLDRATRD